MELDISRRIWRYSETINMYVNPKFDGITVRDAISKTLRAIISSGSSHLIKNSLSIAEGMIQSRTKTLKQHHSGTS